MELILSNLNLNGASRVGFGASGLALGRLGWLLGGCAACTESVGVRRDQFTPVEV